MVGGHSLDSQFTDFALNPDVVVATPGRLAHHLVEVAFFFFFLFACSSVCLFV